MPSRPVLTLFLWADGSYFDSIINKYQNHPHFVVPLNPITPSCDDAGSKLCANGTNTEDDGWSNNTVLGDFRNMSDTSLADS